MPHSDSSETTPNLTGHCLCGAVRFSGWLHPTDTVTGCHCSQCRRWSGHYWASVSVLDIEIEDDGQLRWYRASDQASRGFCTTCGSSMFWKADQDDEQRVAVSAAAVEVAGGALDQPTGLKLSRHIYVADKGDYYEITDGVRQDQQE
ncbi:GFA family protein [Paracoccus aminophilus]|uniref:CENP-V/GFA domain-containing protein n=1 Tax=Paracoccus aminophilus JCM 7686 TaxID=1367847 RepID=S5XYW1_PARAH|nr:GFA family protein [Paracoccus aminophilus]AGT10487.1 hypothetical protein JCM7686_3452 [Paracoccus aminophilus JCM 7686]